MSGVTLDNATVAILIGPQWAPATAPTFTGTVASFMAKIRKMSITDEVDKVNTRGAGEPRSKNVYVNAHGNLTLSGVVPATGYNIKTAVAALGAPGAPIGYWIKVSVLPDSALATPDIYEGVITKWDADFNMAEPTMETIEIDLDPG